MIGMLVKGTSSRLKSKKKLQKLQKINEKCFYVSVSQMPFHVAYVFDDVEDIYWAHELLLNNVINLHAPVKERISKPKKPAFINGDLKRAVFKEKMLFSKYKKSHNLI